MAEHFPFAPQHQLSQFFNINGLHKVCPYFCKIWVSYKLNS